MGDDQGEERAYLGRYARALKKPFASDNDGVGRRVPGVRSRCRSKQAYLWTPPVFQEEA